MKNGRKIQNDDISCGMEEEDLEGRERWDAALGRWGTAKAEAAGRAAFQGFPTPWC
jgi:hypothetical protein